MNGGYDWRAAAQEAEGERLARMALDRKMCSNPRYGGHYGGYTYLEAVDKCVPVAGPRNTGMNVQDLVAEGAPDNSQGIAVTPDPALTTSTGGNTNDNGEAAITSEVNNRVAMETQRKPPKPMRRMAGEKMRLA